MIVSLNKGDAANNNVDYVDSLAVNMFTVERAVVNSDSYNINFYGVSGFGESEGVGRGGVWVASEKLQGHFRVSGTSLVEVMPDGATNVLGDVGGTERVSMSYSFNNLAIVSNRKLYYYNIADGFREIDGDNVGQPLDIVWVDGYFMLTDGNNIYHSDIQNEEKFSALSLGNAQISPDATMGLGVNEDNEVVAFGEFSTEYLANRGVNNFSFQRITQKSQKIGISGVHCKKEVGGRWFTIGRRRESAITCNIISLGNEEVISSRAVTQILSDYSQIEISKSYIDAMIIDNTSFVIYQLPRHTLLFNLTIAKVKGTANAWTILQSEYSSIKLFRAGNPVLDPRNSKWIVDDKFTKKLGYIDRSSCLHYDDIATWELYSPTVNLESLSIDLIEIQTIAGISNADDATIAISITTDGRTYSNEFWELYADNFDYSKRFYLTQVGYVRNNIGFKFRGASRSRMALSSFRIEAS